MISINITKPKHIPGLQAAFISMDKFNEALINELRSLDSRRYDTDTKTWEIPVKDLQRVINIVTDDKIDIILDKQSATSTKIPADYEFKTTPYDFQLYGVEYGLNHNNFILADQPGLGKTLQASNIASIRHRQVEVKQCLVICCVNSLKFNWESEIKLHTNESCRVLGQKFRKNGNIYIGSTQDKIEDIKTAKEFFLITNIETLRNDDFIKALKKNTNINMLIIDEAHKVSNHTCQQGKNFQKLNYMDYKIALTGTPVVNRPLDVFAVLKVLGIEKSNYSTFKKFYCTYGGFGNYAVTGYKNLNVLKESLSSCMLRRLKADVISLPPKTFKNEYLEMTDKQAKIYEEVRKQLLDNIDLIAESLNPLTQLLRLRQAAGYTGILSSEIQESCKFDRCEEIIDEVLANDEKILILSNWTEITNPLYERLKKYKPVLITGQIKDVDRRNYNDRFQTDPNCNVCIGTIGAVGTGLTFNAASYVVFLDLPWNYANYEQAYSRLERIGQKRNMTIINLLIKNTIDEKILNLVYTKKEYSDILVDNKPLKLDRRLLLDLLN